MFITGLGVGPMFAIFTLVVQGAVQPRQIGTATSSLTLFQQIGGSVGLAVAGTAFGTRLVEELPRQLAASPIPPQIIAALPSSAGAVGQLVGVGNIGQAILAGVPAGARAQLEPYLPDIVAAIYRAFSLATANTFIFGVVAAVVAGGAIALLREAPVRVPAAQTSRGSGALAEPVE
jgi:hypothetical protein